MSKKTNSNPASEEKAQTASAAEQTEETAQQTEAEAAKQSEDKKPEEAKQQEASEFEKAQQALAQEHDSYLRLAAEYDNYRKRSAREADLKFNDGVSYAVGQIIPILDTLEMAAKAPCADEAFKKGVTMTLDKAAKALENLHIEEIEADAKPFDPNVMNAVSQVPAPEGVESGTVVTVYQKGYRIGDKIIRHATVVVAE